VLTTYLAIFLITTLLTDLYYADFNITFALLTIFAVMLILLCYTRSTISISLLTDFSINLVLNLLINLYYIEFTITLTVFIVILYVSNASLTHLHRAASTITFENFLAPMHENCPTVSSIQLHVLRAFSCLLFSACISLAISTLAS
jgi:hypothetical protein